MYCPNCGKADQKENTFCRQCGNFLPDFEKIIKKKTSPEDHLKANTFLSLLTGIVSLTLAVILYAMFLGRADTPIIIYVVAGFLTAIFFWQAQTFWRTILLKKEFGKREKFNNEQEEIKTSFDKSVPTKELLPEADFNDIVPASVTENTTKTLSEKVKPSTQTEH